MSKTNVNDKCQTQRKTRLNTLTNWKGSLTEASETNLEIDDFSVGEEDQPWKII